MRTISQQPHYFIAFVILSLLLAGASYLQTYGGINPCPLCILQRFTFGLLGIVFLLGVIISFKRCAQIGVAGLGFLVSLLGIILSGRQVWLQHLPHTLDANCDVSLNYMLKVLPLQEVLQKVFAGGTLCAQVEWQFLGLSLASWSLIWFFIFALFCLRQLFKKTKVR